MSGGREESPRPGLIPSAPVFSGLQTSSWNYLQSRKKVRKGIGHYPRETPCRVDHKPENKKTVKRRKTERPPLLTQEYETCERSETTVLGSGTHTRGKTGRRGYLGCRVGLKWICGTSCRLYGSRRLCIS